MFPNALEHRFFFPHTAFHDPQELLLVKMHRKYFSKITDEWDPLLQSPQRHTLTLTEISNVFHFLKKESILYLDKKNCIELTKLAAKISNYL